jgi:glycosyltransferase involved in cell wall biosynthesis
MEVLDAWGVYGPVVAWCNFVCMGIGMKSNVFARLSHTACGGIHMAWRLFPASLRRSSMTRVASLIAEKPGKAPMSSDGAIIAGDISGLNGIAESGRILRRALVRLGYDRGAIPLGLPSVAPAFQGAIPEGAAIISVVNAPFLPVGISRLSKGTIRGRRSIGVWVWELSAVPKEWKVGARFVHNIWAPSQFCADAFEEIAPGRVRVVPYPLAAVPQNEIQGDRRYFGLPDHAFVVLCAFHMSSSFERKNPLASISAFRLAFGDNTDAILVLKVTIPAGYEEELGIIHQAVGSASNIIVIVENLSEQKFRSLIASCDVVLSLHRSEGFGLTLANAALMEKPVVATGWSGNLEFMNAECSALVSCRLIPVVDTRKIYTVEGALWADPSIEDAANWLRKLFDNDGLRIQMGHFGRLHAERTLGARPLIQALESAGIY